MKRNLYSVCLALILFSTSLYAADAPKTIAGITVGRNIKDIADKLEMDTALPIWGSEYLSKVSLKPVKGFHSGYVVYGNCQAPGRIVRVKLNYEDDSGEFYDRLYSELTRRYGKPVEWRGNPFGSLKIWKWSLKDSDKNSISVILQRYEGDDDSFTKGNSIKVGIANFVEEERACFDARKDKSQGRPAIPSKDIDFNWFLPH